MASRFAAAAAGCAVLLAGWMIPGRAEPDGEWSIGLDSGYDGEVLADPERDGLIESVSAPFAVARTRLRVAWSDVGARDDRLTLMGAVAGTRFGNDGPDHDVDLHAAGQYGLAVTRRLRVDGGLNGRRFRRSPLPLFDLDEIGADAGVAWQLDSVWLVDARVTNRWPFFPGRLIAVNSTETQRDRQLDAQVSLSRRHSGTAMTRVSLGHRTSRSNDSLLAYRGPLAAILVWIPAWRRSTLSAYVSYAARTYPDYPVLQASGTPTGRQRHDKTRGIGLQVEGQISRRWRIQITLQHMHQTSNVDAMAFDQLRLLAGVSTNLWRRSSPAASHKRPLIGIDAPDKSTPRLELLDDGIRFRCRAAGARAVSVVGGFNHWNVVSNPLADPDGDGIWEAVVAVPSGIWRYAFIVDGEWVTPQNAERYEDDGFGGTVGLVEYP